MRDNSDYLHATLSAWSGEERERFTNALLDACEVVVLQLADLDEAFQMFDSQNSRGKALYPTDLLKAFHLRELGDDEQSRASVRELVRLWEDIPPPHIHALFNNYLFPVKQWALGRGVPREGFTADHIGRFKGIREGDGSNAQNRWAHAFMYAKNFTHDFASENASLVRFGVLSPLAYPYQIDQPALNGETFFRMVDHYYRQGRQLGLAALRTSDGASSDNVEPSQRNELAELDGATQQNHKHSRYAYIRLLVDCLVLYYTDRFGTQRADDFARLAAQYALGLRAPAYAVRWQSVNKYAVDGVQESHERSFWNRQSGLFQHIRDAQSPRNVLDYVVRRPEMYVRSGKRNDDDEKLVKHYWPPVAYEESE